jgi:biopolymer transport protein ExbB/TolQ
MEHLSELGVGGILALLILKEVFSFMRSKKAVSATRTQNQLITDSILKGLKGIQSDPCYNEHKKIGKMMEDMTRKINDLYKWHDVEDSEGVKVWYVRKSLEEAIVKLSSSIEKQTELLRVITDEFRSSRKDFQYLTKEVHEIKKK